MSPVRPPGGGPVPGAVFRRLLRGGGWHAGAALAPLRRLAGGGTVTLHRSGREALRVALLRAAAETGRREVVIPAYTCFSVPAAAVAAGLRVRLADVDDRGRLELASLPPDALDRAAAVVVCNLFGVPEPLAPIREAAEGAGARVIDDAAQALGGRTAEGPCGGRGVPAVLSFGRGKPLSALGGGALLWPDAAGEGEPGGAGTTGPGAGAPRPPGATLAHDLAASGPASAKTEEAPAPAAVAADGGALPGPGPAARAGAILRGLAWNAARRPAVFDRLRRIPALHIGETRFDPGFARGAIAPASLALLACTVPELERICACTAERVRALAARLPGGTGFEPLVAGAGEHGGYPRLVLRAPAPGARDRALRELEDAGATGLYPSSLERVEPLMPHLVPGPRPVRAGDLAARVLTLPAPEDDRELEELAARLARVLPRSG